MGIHNGKGRLARVDVSFELDFVSELFGLKKREFGDVGVERLEV